MSGTVYTVASGKGGVGKTTTSVNLAVALWQEGNAVGLVDADIGMANLAAVLNLEPEATLHDVLSGRATVEEALVEAQGGNLLVLPGDRSLESFATADPRELRAAVDDLAERCDYVIVDTGAGLSYEDVLPLGMAHGVLLVTTPDPAAFGDTRKTMEVADLLGAPVRGLVVTRAVEDTDAAAIAGEIGAELLGTIPEDPAVMGSTVAGNPLESHAPDSAAAGAYRDLAATLLSGDDEWLEAHPREPAATVDEVTQAVAAESDESADYGNESGEVGAGATVDAVDSEESGDIGDVLAGPGEDGSDEERGPESPYEASAVDAAEAEGALEDEETESGAGDESAETAASSAEVGEPADDDEAPDAEEAGDLDGGDEPDEAAELDESDEATELDEPDEAEEGEASGDEEGEASEVEAAEADVAADEEAGEEDAGDEALEASDESEDEDRVDRESEGPVEEEETDESEDEGASEDSAEPEAEEPEEPEKRGGLFGWLGRLF